MAGTPVRRTFARVDRVTARLRAVVGDTALFADGHLFAARWIGLPASGGQHFLLNTGTPCGLGYYTKYRLCGFGTGLPSTSPHDDQAGRQTGERPCGSIAGASAAISTTPSFWISTVW